MKLNKKYFFSLLLVLIFILSSFIFVLTRDAGAASWWDKQKGLGDSSVKPIGEAFGAASGEPQDIRVIVASLINTFLGLLGIIFVVLMVYGGFKWMTAAGNDENVATAKKIISTGAIGLAIVLISWGLATFVGKMILEAAQKTPPTGG